MINKKGFTLAEVLITIGILGVIAAVTLPALNTNLSKSQLEVQTRKFYTQFSKALDLYKVDNETDSISDTDFNTNEFVRKYFKVASQCTESEQCYAKQYQTQEKKTSFTPATNWFNKNSTYILDDGTVFTIQTPTDRYPGVVYFDVNGKKGPNKIGYDFWSASIFYDGSVDEGGVTPEIRKNYPGEMLEKQVESRFKGCKDGSYGGCFGHFKRNNFKFDY